MIKVVDEGNERKNLPDSNIIAAWFWNELK